MVKLRMTADEGLQAETSSTRIQKLLPVTIS